MPSAANPCVAISTRRPAVVMLLGRLDGNVNTFVAPAWVLVNAWFLQRCSPFVPLPLVQHHELNGAVGVGVELLDPEQVKLRRCDGRHEQSENRNAATHVPDA